MDSIDVFVRLVKRGCSKINKSIRLLFQHIFNGGTHTDMEAYFTNTYLFCLYKDPDDPTQLRPIGIPTALRRIITIHIARVYRQRFARHLLPHNYAVGIDGGMDFVVRASQLAIEKYITEPMAQDLPDAPTRCYISLDLKNMFNEISRNKIFEIVEAKFPELLPFIALLYKNPGTVFYRMTDGSWQTQSMEEGVNQGCPLSSILAALVLQEVLVPLTEKLNARAMARALQHSGDDGHGGETHPMAYVDDCGACVPVQDVAFFLEEFTQLATPLGCHLNTKKTVIMTSTSGDSGLPAIERAYGAATAAGIRQAIADFTAGEQTRGLRLLGQPLGSRTFAASFLASKLKDNKRDATALLEAVPNHQTALRLFAQCTLHKLPHLLASEVMYHFTENQYERWDE